MGSETSIPIAYDHDSNTHSLTGPMAALPKIFPEGMPSSILDVGCGTGTWLAAAKMLGAATVTGIDGVSLPPEKLHIPAGLILHHDLNNEFDLGQRYDVVFCLEVAEHLPFSSASRLIMSLTRHANKILFSAASPGQPGQNHINCQWPEYWQGLFNANGFACDDSIRWRIWDDSNIEPWYRQNMYWATREPKIAGKESRIKPVIHPAWFEAMINVKRSEQADEIANGAMPLRWHLRALVSALLIRLRRGDASFRPDDLPQ
jgi:SAM-dependent methyltransferase